MEWLERSKKSEVGGEGRGSILEPSFLLPPYPCRQFQMPSAEEGVTDKGRDDRRGHRIATGLPNTPTIPPSCTQFPQKLLSGQLATGASTPRRLRQPPSIPFSAATGAAGATPQRDGSLPEAPGRQAPLPRGQHPVLAGGPDIVLFAAPASCSGPWARPSATLYPGCSSCTVSHVPQAAPDGVRSSSPGRSPLEVPHFCLPSR